MAKILGLQTQGSSFGSYLGILFPRAALPRKLRANPRKRDIKMNRGVSSRALLLELGRNPFGWKIVATFHHPSLKYDDAGDWDVG